MLQWSRATDITKAGKPQPSPEEEVIAPNNGYQLAESGDF
jgi:hypothetical protein